MFLKPNILSFSMRFHFHSYWVINYTETKGYAKHSAKDPTFLQSSPDYSSNLKMLYSQSYLQ